MKSDHGIPKNNTIPPDISEGQQILSGLILSLRVGSARLVGLRVIARTQITHYNIDTKNKEAEKEKKRERESVNHYSNMKPDKGYVKVTRIQESHIGLVTLGELHVAVLTKTSYYNEDRENKDRERREEKRREEKRRERDQPLRQHEARPKKVRHYLVTG